MDPWASANAWDDTEDTARESSTENAQTWSAATHYLGSDIIAGPLATWSRSTSVEPTHWTQTGSVGTDGSLNPETVWSQSIAPQGHEKDSWDESSPDNDQTSTSLESESPPDNQDLEHLPSSDVGAVEDPSPGLNYKAFVAPLDGSRLESHPQTPELEHPSSSSPEHDAFGSFETGLQPVSAAHLLLISERDFPPASEGIESWSGAWESAEHSSQRNSEDSTDVGDEWETAKRQKAVADRVLPPGLLASMLQQCKDVMSYVWSSPLVVPTESSSAEWREGLTIVEGIETTSTRFIVHDISSPSQPSPHRFQTVKLMGEALKFTRHLPMVTRSPLGLYFASKGSTAWETSVKTRVDVTPDDLPVGWRVAQKNEQIGSDVKASKDLSKRASFLSFWAKRPDQPVGDVRSLSADPTHAASGSRLDFAEISLTPALPVKQAVSPTTSIPLDVPTKTTSLTTHLHDMNVEFSQTPSIDVRTSTPVPETSQPGPSAVSRFLNRFSRSSRTTAPVSSRHNSIALSGDDLEFLNDLNLVPGVADDDDLGNDPQIQALQSMMKETPYMVANKVDTPILAPPPPPPKASLTTSSNISTPMNSLRSPTAAAFDAETNLKSTDALRVDSAPFPLFESFTAVSEQLPTHAKPSKQMPIQPKEGTDTSFWGDFTSTPPPSQTPDITSGKPMNRTAEASSPPSVSTPERLIPSIAIHQQTKTSVVLQSIETSRSDDDEFSDFHSSETYYAPGTSAANLSNFGSIGYESSTSFGTTKHNIATEEIPDAVEPTRLSSAPIAHRPTRKSIPLVTSFNAFQASDSNRPNSNSRSPSLLTRYDALRELDLLSPTSPSHPPQTISPPSNSQDMGNADSSSIRKQGSHKKQVSVSNAEHERTVGLMKMAARQSGTWPTVPLLDSPFDASPAADQQQRPFSDHVPKLEPPPGIQKVRNKEVVLMDLPVITYQNEPNTSSLNVNMPGLYPVVESQSSIAKGANSGVSGTKLSAQDLSFFESFGL